MGEDRSEGRGRAEAEPGALGSTKDAPRARAGFQTKPSLVSLVPLINSFITCTRGTGGGNPSPAPPGDASRSDSTPFFPFPSLHQDVPSLETLEHELAWMKETLSQLGSPVVLCHNDLLCKNIIYNRTQGWCAAARRAQPGGVGGLSPVSCPLTPTGTPWLRPQPLAAPRFAFTEQVRFIDYEYTGYNYQAFDIGNHFNEFAGEPGSSSQLPRPPRGWRRLPEGSPSLGCR